MTPGNLDVLKKAKGPTPPPADKAPAEPAPRIPEMPSGNINVLQNAKSPAPSEPAPPEPAAGDTPPVEVSPDDPKYVDFDHLGALLNGRFESWRTLRITVERQWIEDLRAFNGIDDNYVENICASSPATKVFVQLTRTKCLAGMSALREAMFPTKGKNWGLKATPVPEMAQGAEITDPNTGMQIPMQPQDVKRMAELAMANMELEMEDQLTELYYDRVIYDMLLELCTVGTGAVKGVIPDVRAKPLWQVGATNEWDMVHNEEPYPRIEYVSIFDLYPDPYATDLARATGIFERHVLNRIQMQELTDNPKFDAAVIKGLLISAGSGTHQEFMHEIDLRTMAGTLASAVPSDRFDVMEYWGLVRGTDLDRAGVETPDPDADYYANIWFCAGKTLYAALSPLKRQTLPYHIVPYEKIPHKLHGIGPSRMIRDSQIMLNAATRTALDNMALSSGPQVEVNTAVIADNEDPNDLRPWKIWLREGGDPAYPMLRFYQPESNIGELQNLIDMFRKFAEDESNIPSYSYGQNGPTGTNKTAAGMSMMMSAAKVSNNAVVGNIDRFLITPLITSLFDWNMQWNAKPQIKGDMKVIACGSTTLMAKEVQSQRLIQFAQITANPLDASVVNRAELIKEIADALDLDSSKLLRPELEDPNIQGQTIAPNLNPPSGVGSPHDIPVPTVGGESTESGAIQ